MRPSSYSGLNLSCSAVFVAAVEGNRSQRTGRIAAGVVVGILALIIIVIIVIIIVAYIL